LQEFRSYRSSGVTGVQEFRSAGVTGVQELQECRSVDNTLNPVNPIEKRIFQN